MDLSFLKEFGHPESTCFLLVQADLTLPHAKQYAYAQANRHKRGERHRPDQAFTEFINSLTTRKGEAEQGLQAGKGHGMDRDMGWVHGGRRQVEHPGRDPGGGETRGTLGRTLLQ
jgi:hypothetical protein